MQTVHRALRAFVGTTLVLVTSLSAQTSPTGVITGRIFNPATREYVRNAQVVVRGTDMAAISEDGGYYSLRNVPAGEVTIAVNYTGYEAPPASLMVAPGQTAVRDFNLVSTEQKRSVDGAPIKLDQFVVSAEREGNAKALMDQRRNQNITNVVASDLFGDISEGNLGEFVKFLPGVDIELNGGEARAPRIHGMDPQYAAVTMNGMRLASGDAYTHFLGTQNVDAGEGSRMFNFSEVSLNNLEAVEVFKTNSADMDADAPAGTINLKTKRAFDRKGRRIGWQVSAMINSTDFHLRETYGPGDDKHHKYRPGALLDYSDVFFNNRLGIVVNVSQSNMFWPEQRVSPTLQQTPSATDPRPVVITRLEFLDNPRFTERTSGSITIDYKVSPNLAVSLHTSMNEYALRSSNRTLQFTFAANNTSATGRSSVLGDGLTTLQTSAAGGSSRAVAAASARGFNKLSTTTNIFPSFEYKRGPLLVEGKGGMSRSISHVRGIDEGAASYTRTSAYTGVDFRAERSGPWATDWKVSQLSGNDWSDLSNYRNPVLGDEYRDGKDQNYTGELSAKLVMPWKTTTWFKTGFKVQERIRDYEDTSVARSWQYVGPNRNATSFVGYESPTPIDLKAYGIKIQGITSGGPPVYFNRKRLTEAFQEHPDWFVPNATAANWLTANVRNMKDYKEQINAAYLTGFTNIKGLRMQTGVRWEQTNTSSLEYDPLPGSQVLAAGFPVSGGIATTVPGMIYQYQTRPRVVRSARYDNLFPSFSAKYDIRPNLVGHFGYNKSILRPGFNHISGLWAIDEVNARVTVPNPGLLPEQSEKFLVRFERYFEPVGQFGIGGFYNQFKNLRERDELTAEEFGFGDDPFYSEYTFITQTSGSGTKRFKGYEVDYRQQLSFLPGVLQGTGVFGNYTRTITTGRRPGTAPHHVKCGLSYRYRRFNGVFNAVWYPEVPLTTTSGRYREDEAKYDVSANYRLTDKFALFCQGKNITNKYQVTRTMTQNGPREFQVNQFGAMWTFGVKGNF
ncbi:MAG: TonB-dependent receptor [Opitutaceae bacterium]|nr:TonB-dependent receptor [Opitutaceae bacterium]